MKINMLLNNNNEDDMYKSNSFRFVHIKSFTSD